MLIKPIKNTIDTQEDIKNILNRRRTVIIYRYNKPHNTEYCYFRENYYDLFILNHSVLEGIGFVAPKDTTLYHRNSYRGCIVDPFLPDGTLNMNAEIKFLTGWYATRFVNRYNEPLWVDRKNEIHDNKSLIDHYTHTVNSRIMQPLPIYYTFEDQVRLEASKSYQDFNYSFCFMKDVPYYRLSDFQDAYTKFVIIDLEEDNFISGDSTINKIYTLDQISMANESAKEIVSVSFVQCLEVLTRSIFSQAYIIFDFETENTLLNIDKTQLRLKYDYKLSNQEITREYARLVMEFDQIGASLNEMIFFDQSIASVLPTKVYFFISDTINKIKLGGFKHISQHQLKHSVGYSSSDCDEQMFRYSMGMYPFEFMERNPDIERDISIFVNRLMIDK